jgi:hypothetical protein
MNAKQRKKIITATQKYRELSIRKMARDKKINPEGFSV